MSAINIYEYTDFREYLKAYFDARKRVDPKFSHRYLSRRLGLSSPNFIMMVMQGKRTISQSMTFRISGEFNHNPLYRSDGTTPAAGVTVCLRLKKSLADTSASSGMGISRLLLASTGAAHTAPADTVVTTDGGGRYAFGPLPDTGTYVIEAVSGNDAVFIDSVAIKDPAVAVTLPPDTLKPAGAITGIVGLPSGGDPRKVYVVAFGIDRYANVNQNGRFRFTHLAEAVYDLRLVSGLKNYASRDTAGIPVRSGRYQRGSDIRRIRKRYSGRPNPA